MPTNRIMVGILALSAGANSAEATWTSTISCRKVTAAATVLTTYSAFANIATVRSKQDSLRDTAQDYTRNNVERARKKFFD